MGANSVKRASGGFPESTAKSLLKSPLWFLKVNHVVFFHKYYKQTTGVEHPKN